MWIVIAQIICLAVAVGLLAIVYELDKNTPSYVRYGILVVALAFFAVFLITFRNRDLYEHAAAIAFTGLGALVVGGVLYLILTHQIQPVVVKILGATFGVSLLLWVVGSCSDIKRQQIQIESSSVPTSSTVSPADSTEKAISEFNRICNEK